MLMQSFSILGDNVVTQLSPGVSAVCVCVCEREKLHKPYAGGLSKCSHYAVFPISKAQMLDPDVRQAAI